MKGARFSVLLGESDFLIMEEITTGSESPLKGCNDWGRSPAHAAAICGGAVQGSAE